MMWRRRRLLQGLAGALALPVSAWGAAAPRQLNILTSYPDEVMARFEAAFEQRYPQYRIRYLWRMPHDALPYLENQSGADTVDVFWAASPRTFARLKSEHLLRKLELDRSGLPSAISKTVISDPDGYYLATEVAGYVVAYNTASLAKLGVSPPRDWPELANPSLAGNIALPVPSEVGFAPVMYDIVLQAFGWERGWALWSEIAALSVLVHRGATFISEDVGSGKIAVGLSIDFFVKAAISNGAPLRQSYPQHNGMNPGHVALPVAGTNSAGAQAFAEFVLSPQGQALLLHPEIRKLPVRPATYAAAGAGEFNPFAAAEQGSMDYDGALSRERLNVISAVFDAMLAQPHEELRVLWHRVHAAEARGMDMAPVRAVLSAPPLSESEARADAVKRPLQATLEGAKASGNAEADALKSAWAERCTARRATARGMLEQMKA